MRFLLLAICTLSLAACGGAGNDTEESFTDDELRSSSLKSISVNQSVGFRPPPPSGSCWDGGRWKVVFGTKRLTGNACVDGRARELDRPLSDAEVAKVRAAVAGIRTTRRPTACPTDMPVRSVTVEKGSSETHYVESRAACGGGSKPAVGETIGALVDLMRELSAADEASSGDIALGPLEAPGARLKGETFELSRGASLSFETSENQIRFIRGVDIQPADVVTAKDEVVQDREDGLLGGSTRIKRTFTVSEDAEVGTVAKLSTSTCFQVREDPDWKFDFRIKVK